jgi:hypothetical protein
VIEDFAVLCPPNENPYGVIAVCKEDYAVVMFGFDKRILMVALDEGQEYWENKFIVQTCLDVRDSPLPENSNIDPILIAGFAAHDLAKITASYHRSAKMTFGVGTSWPFATPESDGPVIGNYAVEGEWEISNGSSTGFFNAWAAVGDYESGVNLYIVSSKDQWEICLENDRRVPREDLDDLRSRTKRMILPDSCETPLKRISGQPALFVKAACDYYGYMNKVMSKELKCPPCRYLTQAGDDRIVLN